MFTLFYNAPLKFDTAEDMDDAIKAIQELDKTVEIKHVSDTMVLACIKLY